MPTDPATPPNRKLEAQLNAEWTDRWLSCMRDNGYEPHPRDDGGWNFDGNSDAVSAQVGACSKQAGPEVTYAPITPSEASHLYDLELAANACLADHGVAVTTPPSREQYIESVLTQKVVNGVAMTPKQWQAFDAVLDWDHWGAICPVPSLWPE
jgi:hypothetical protein